MESVEYPNTSHMIPVFPYLVSIQHIILNVPLNRKKFVVSNVYTPNEDDPVLLHSGCVRSHGLYLNMLSWGDFNVVWSPGRS